MAQMLKLVGHLAHPPERVAELFAAVELWPEWMSDIRRVRVVERQGQRVSVEFRQRQLGRDLHQQMELQVRGLRLLQTQRSAAMNWRGDWQFLLPPDGHGTTLSLAIDLELLGMGRFLPDQLVRSTMDQWFCQLLEGAEDGLSKGLARCSPPVPADLLTVVDTNGRLAVRCGGQQIRLWGAEARAERVVLELWHTRRGLELEVAGRRRVLAPAARVAVDTS